MVGAFSLGTQHLTTAVSFTRYLDILDQAMARKKSRINALGGLGSYNLVKVVPRAELRDPYM